MLDILLGHIALMSSVELLVVIVASSVVLSIVLGSVFL